MKSILIKPFLFIAIILCVAACNDPDDTIARVTVIDVNGARIADASVRLFGDGSGSTVSVGDIRVDETEVTNAAGEAIFDFTDFYEAGQAGLFVLNIEVEKDSLSAESVIKVEPEKVNEETVILQ